jgi:hypothetical protein
MEAVKDIRTIPLDPIALNEELVYQPPPAPADRTLILLHQFTKSDQYWRHDPEEMRQILGLPEIYFEWNATTLLWAENTTYDQFTGDLASLSVDDTRLLIDLRDRELRRRQEGIHIFINGKINYLTGDNYNFLVYYVIPDFGYPQYRRFQRDVFYVIDLADKNEHCLGAIIAKAKKTGLSHILTSCFLNRAMMVRKRAFGVMNKSQDDANDLNINFFWQGYEEYPPIMKPFVSHKNLSKIIFGSPLVKYTGTKQSILKQVHQQRNKPLDTWVYSAPTSPQLKFDGPLMYWIHVDEFLKIKKLRQIIGKMTETVKKQQTIVGKIFMTSYPPEEDSESFYEGKELYFESKLTTIDKESILPRTKSGFICYFVGALVSTDGTFDKYGEADEQKALALNQAERDRCKNSTELQEKIRQYCRTEEECFRSGGSGSTFNNNRLAAAVSMVESKMRNSTTPLWVDGDLNWSRGRVGKLEDFLKSSNVNVEWTPRTEFDKKNPDLGWWRVYESYAPSYHNRVYRDENGLWTPAPDSPFVMATDPPEYKTKSSVQATGSKPSNAAIVAMNFLDVQRNTMLGRVASKLVMLEYLGRREDPDDYLEDLIKTCFWLGCYVLIEANKAWVVTAFEKLGLQNFLLVRLADRTIVPYNLNNEENIPVATSGDIIETYCRLGNTYMRAPATKDDVDYLMHCKSIRLMNGLMGFTPHDTKKFDLEVCFLLCLLAMYSFSAFAEELKRKHKKLDYLKQAFDAIVNHV